MKLAEITLNRVKLAYKRTGMKPQTGPFIEDGKCCALAALALELGITSESPDTAWQLVLDAEDLVMPFAMGFDRPFGPQSYPSESEQKAFIQGQKIARGLGLGRHNDNR